MGNKYHVEVILMSSIIALSLGGSDLAGDKGHLELLLGQRDEGPGSELHLGGGVFAGLQTEARQQHGDGDLDLHQAQTLCDADAGSLAEGQVDVGGPAGLGLLAEALGVVLAGLGPVLGVVVQRAHRDDDARALVHLNVGQRDLPVHHHLAVQEGQGWVHAEGLVDDLVEVGHLHDGFIGDLAVVAFQDVLHLLVDLLLDVVVLGQFVHGEGSGGRGGVEASDEEDVDLGHHLVHGELASGLTVLRYRLGLLALPRLNEALVLELHQHLKHVGALDAVLLAVGDGLGDQLGEEGFDLGDGDGELELLSDLAEEEEDHEADAVEHGGLHDLGADTAELGLGSLEAVALDAEGHGGDDVSADAGLHLADVSVVPATVGRRLGFHEVLQLSAALLHGLEHVLDLGRGEGGRDLSAELLPALAGQVEQVGGERVALRLDVDAAAVEVLEVLDEDVLDDLRVVEVEQGLGHDEGAGDGLVAVVLVDLVGDVADTLVTHEVGAEVAREEGRLGARHLALGPVGEDLGQVGVEGKAQPGEQGGKSPADHPGAFLFTWYAD